MENGKMADLDISTIIALSGMPLNKDIVNPKKTVEMSKRVRVTFRTLPASYKESDIEIFRESLRECLKANQVGVIPWSEATSEDNSSLMSRILKSRKVKRNIDAVIDVQKNQSAFKKVLSTIAEWIYKLLRNSNRSVMDILKISSWADDFTAKYVQDPFKTQIITLMKLDPEFDDKSTSYDKKISIGLKNLISTMSEIVIGVSKNKFAIINMNLSDSLYKHDELVSFVTKSLIPKIFAPIKPPILNRFAKGEFDSLSSESAEKLSEMGKTLRNTGLFPEGSKFSDKISRQSHRDVVNRILDGRTGVSYGFIALAEVPQYLGGKELDKDKWDQLSCVDGLNADYLRKSEENNRWYVKTCINGKEIFQQIPDIWIVTSRSGCDKTNLNLKTDIVRIGLINGQLHLEVPKGVDLNRRDIRPSFDTYVMLAQALSTSLYKPEIIKDGMPILHFHGYPASDWFSHKEYHAGATNPSLPCGTVEAALLNFSAIYDLANKNSGHANLFCLVESDHGVNIIGPDKDYIVNWLKNGKASGGIMLGGTHLPSLKKSESQYLAN